MCWKRWLDDFWHFWHLTSLYQGWRPFGWNTSKCGQQGLDFTVCYMPSQVFFYFRQKYSPSTASLLENCLVFTWYWAPGNNEDATGCFIRKKVGTLKLGIFDLRLENQKCVCFEAKISWFLNTFYLFIKSWSKMHYFSATSICLVS